MAADSTVWRYALEALATGQQPILLLVVDASGSVPGKPGATMVVSAAGRAGTIGGGIAEQELAAAAQQLESAARLATFHHTPDSGSLCAGTQVVAMLRLGERHVPTLQALADCLAADNSGLLIADPDDISFTPGVSSPPRFVRDADDSWRFEATVGATDTLFIIGGGHVCLALSRIVATLPFRIVVLDNRADLDLMRDNSFAHETRVIAYDEVARHVSSGPRSWAVIMTHGHRHDREVLEQLLGHELAYLGMIGSPSKVARIFADLEEHGVAPEVLSRVHAPIGLDIASHTPAEIAISIAAEIVKVRNTSR